MDDMFHPDNPKREDRLKNLSAQMDQQLRLIMEESETINNLCEEITALLHNFKDLCQKVKDLVPQTNADLIKKLDSLISRLTNLTETIQVEVVSGSYGFLIPKYIGELIGSIAAGKYASKHIDKAIKNAFVKRLFAKQGVDYAEKAVRSSLVIKFPRWIKWNVGGKIGGFVSGAFFAVAVDMVFSAIFGQMKKNQLQDVLRESLDCRFYSTKAKLINQIVTNCFIEVKGKIQGGMAILKMADKYYNKQPKTAGNIAIAEEILAQLNIDELLDETKEKVKQVDDELILKTLQSMDATAKFKDDFEATWKPLGEQQFFQKYPQTSQ